MNKVVKGFTKKSEGMKALYVAGCEIKEIAEFYGVRYNFVYNVVSNYCRMNDVELRTNHRNTGNFKKDEIIARLKNGEACVKISADLKTNINYVYKLRKELEAM